MTKVTDIIKLLNLVEHPKEGGFFIETYRAQETIKQINLKRKCRLERSLTTTIYYLLTSESFSEIHRLSSDEIYHFYLGDPVEMLMLFPNGEGQIFKIGNKIFEGMRPQIIVPKGIWQGCRVISGGNFALLGTTVSPGFDYQDYQSGLREELIRLYPGFKELIVKLTRENSE